METNYYNEQEEERMMREEYGRDFGGCLWGFVACIIFAVILCCVVLFT